MRLIALVVLGCLSQAIFAAEKEVTFAVLEQQYQPAIRPLLIRYCHECHAGERVEAEIDLATFSTWNDVRKHPRVWQKIGEMLDTGQMPPKDADQPPVGEREKLRTWVRGYLTLEAKARAGDPGRVVLRRLSNAEYTFTLRDLTGIESLDPAREFPVDGAAGEGFTNTGNALVMSPALLTKYLDAAKEVSRHAVLLPDGFRFSPHTTPRDWTNDILAEIRSFYQQFTDSQGGDKVNLQGIVFDTNQGGRLPIERYLAATISKREALTAGQTTIAAVANDGGLNAKYLGTLWSSLNSSEPSLLLDGIRRRWRTAKPDDATAITAEIAAWQKGLWRFATVGHIGKVGGPTRWMEPVNPLVDAQELRFKIPAEPGSDDVVISLISGDAGDGNEHDFVVWQNPRLVAPGRPDLLLRDVRDVTRNLLARREQLFADTAKYLNAAAEARLAPPESVTMLAEKYGVNADGLRAWLECLGIGGAVELRGHFTEQLTSASGYDFIQGWGSHSTPLLLANSSDQHVRVPGNMWPHSVAMHPSPTLRACVGWRSPVTANMRIEGKVAHAHPECGNGVTWSLEIRRGSTRQRLAAGIAQGSKEVSFGPIENIAIHTGDLVSVLIGPRDGNHSCDLTTVELKLRGNEQSWSLSEDVSGNVRAGNPHADRLGNAAVWHFYTEPDSGNASDYVIPEQSLLAKWQAAEDPDEKRTLAESVHRLLTEKIVPEKETPDANLYRQLSSLNGPLLGRLRSAPPLKNVPTNDGMEWGLDPALFGRHPNGSEVDAASLCVQAPAVLQVRLPADLAAGCELAVTGVLHHPTGDEGSVQLSVIAGKVDSQAGLRPSQVQVGAGKGPWTANNREVAYATPILVNRDSGARRRIEKALNEFRALFPAALCYMKIVPVDEVVTLTLYYREDDQLMRLMLDDEQRAYLDRLWDQLHYVSRDAPALVDALAQIIEYATQDADPKVFEPLRKPFAERAETFRQRLIETEPVHLETLIDFANRAYRRPVTSGEVDEVRQLYRRLRELEMSHDEAFRLTLARILVAPSFLYHIEQPLPGDKQSPVGDWELASRLSYFLWSSQPDDELSRLAAAGQLHETDVLLAQTHRMLRDAKVRRLAIEFACQWLHIHDFDHLDEKSERHFPTFGPLRGPMYEESIRFFTDLFQNDGSVLDILNADYMFVNAELANHYDIPNITGSEWRRVEGVKPFSRGGILAQATTLAKQSGASRTSPILRGNWISEVLLGERLPRPPKGVPPLPEDEATTDAPVRVLVEEHSSNEKCAVCHRRIDPLGFSLERFDAIGRLRDRDLGDRPIDTRVTTIDGAEFDGLDGLRNYLLTVRRDAFLRQFCRKLLGYALSRAVQLSDEPLLAEMQTDLASNKFRVVTAIEAIVRSRQFREIRGRDTADEE